MANVKRISIGQYEAMTDAWAKSGKISDVATAGSVSVDVAKRAINEGQDGYPPIRARVERLRIIHMQEEDARREEETRIARAATRKILHDGVKAAREMKLVPRGQLVTNPDGSTEIHCDEKTYGTVIGLIEKAVSLRNVLDGKSERPSIGVGVQVNVGDSAQQGEHLVTPVPQMSPEETRRQAREIMRAYMPRIDEKYGYGNATTEIISALSEAARLRSGDSANAETR